LEASYRNIPQSWDEEVYEPRYPISLKYDNLYPTLPRYNKREHFGKFDLDTLFFVFYF